MKKLVYLEPDKIDAEPFTTSDIIAEHTNINYRSVQRITEKYENSLSEFGRVRFQITPFETKGGVQNKKIYRLNEQQATLLITFLKNTPVVVKFKTELVRQFYAMREELTRRHAERISLKPIRRELTDVIKQTDDDVWAYKKYTDLSYKAVTGKIARVLRQERGAPKDAKAVDYMSADEIRAIAEMQYKIAVLLDIGMDYNR
ncbi:MAG: Rha family transcriptional regulator, partial [Oscillospiraceae bacterium]|nr:Rha family transcriptional regulator [Oscillospiraceae bacterium]